MRFGSLPHHMPFAPTVFNKWPLHYFKVLLTRAKKKGFVLLLVCSLQFNHVHVVERHVVSVSAKDIHVALRVDD